ncbi:hypothetical protein [Scandinavium goeteborgense]|uniref:Uncharacterized protein n=1 Tax=Scandinavium goeteborgense TaxID=1851514 RepID=A0A4R6ENH2_SCAGO|nr:hypothetical protein [Scandinavium goeteborgense]TDN60780.1 hypothetical protein EC847_102366 [Scandinavium goeteborgense]
MANVNQESLAVRIAELESGPRSLKEDFALEAYRMLLPFVTLDPNEFVEVGGPAFYDAVHSLGAKMYHLNMDDVAFEINGETIARRSGPRNRNETERFYLKRKFVGVTNG